MGTHESLPQGEESMEGLLTRARLGDSQALEALVKRSHPLCLQVARGLQRRLGLSLEDVEDAAAAALQLAWEKFPRCRGTRFPQYGAWLRKITYRCCLKASREVRLRHAQEISVEDGPQPLFEVLPDPRAPNPEQAVLQGDRLRRILDVIPTVCNETEQDILFLLWQGTPTNEIAALLGLEEGTVRVKLHRTRSKLAAALQPLCFLTLVGLLLCLLGSL